MNINRTDIITLPKWLIILILPMVISALVSFGVMRSNDATLKEKVSRNTIEIQMLQENKVERNEMNFIINSLTRIEGKLDSHIALPNNNKNKQND